MANFVAALLSTCTLTKKKSSPCLTLFASCALLLLHKAMLPVLVADISDVTEQSSIPPPPVLEGCHASTLADPRGDSAEMILPDASSSEMILSCGGTDPWDSDS